MPTYKDTSYHFARLTPGREHRLGRRLLPVLAGDGTVECEAADGDHPVQVPVRRFLRNVGMVADGASIDELGRAIANPPLLFANSRFQLFVTDARLVIVHDTTDADGARVAGHIRYPWIQSIGFRPKQSFLNDSEIVVDAIEDFDIDGFPKRQSGSYFHRFTFVFDKTFHPGELAREIARRAASYVVSTQGVDQTGPLEELRRAVLLPDPPKGDHSTYGLPVYCAYPGGVFGVGDATGPVGWISQSV